jgi:hypothetical protein
MRVPGNLKGDDNKPLRFNHQMHIYHTKCGIWFDVYFDTDLLHLSIYCNVENLPKHTVDLLGIHFQWLDPEHVQITMPRHGSDYPQTHPIVNLQHRAFNKQQQHVIRPELEDLFPDSILYAWDILQISRAAHKNFRGELEQLCEGWVKFYYYNGDDYRMVRLGHGEDKKDQLFGLTWIFPWAPSVIKAKPSCLELDGTFEAVHPYTLEICEAIIANESLPLGLAIFPTETKKSYQRLHKHLADAIKDAGGGDGEAILKEIPILSDQGKGLEGFTMTQNLIWFHCHRHLIQNAGASSIGGDWLRRLLDAGNLLEAQETARMIRVEMRALEARRKKLWRSDASRTAVMAALAAVEGPNENALKSWARWARLGCPTTTNAAESIHAQLNQHIGRAQSFFHRLKIVKDYLWQRFEQRDHLEFRVSKRSSRKWTDAKKAQTTPGNKVFYDQLYTLGPDRVEAGVAWLFPDFVPAQKFADAEWIQVAKPPPKGWLNKGPRNAPVEGLPAEQGQDDSPATVDTSPQCKATAAALRLGGKIIHSVKIMTGTQKKDAKEMKRLADIVWRCGKELNVLGIESITLEQQAEWRFAVYGELGLLPD